MELKFVGNAYGWEALKRVRALGLVARKSLPSLKHNLALAAGEWCMGGQSSCLSKSHGEGTLCGSNPAVECSRCL